MWNNISTSILNSILKSCQPLQRNKETLYFEARRNVPVSLEDYVKLFPNKHQLRNYSDAFTTGEATPGYIFNPELCLVLKDPVSRTNSHYHHSVLAAARELGSIEKLVQRELKILERCHENFPDILISTNPKYHKGFLDCHHERTLDIFFIYLKKSVFMISVFLFFSS